MTRLSVALVAMTLALAGCGKSPDNNLQGWVEGETIFVSPDEQGRVEELKVRQGDTVEKGALLFTLDDEMQRADVAVREAALSSARLAFGRAEELLKTAAGTQKTMDDARANLKQAQANLDAAQTRLTRRHGFSPASGSVQEVYYRPGETVPSGRPVVALLPPANLKIRFFTPERELAAVNIGDTVTVSCDNCPSSLTATVTYIARNAEYTPPVIYSMEERAKLVYMIEARPSDPSKFRVGQPVTVTRGAAR